MAFDRRTVVIAVLAVLAASAVGVAVGALADNDEDAPPRTDSTGPAPTGSPDGISETIAPSATPTGRAVPVYLLGDTEAGPRLYREFRVVAGPAGPAGADPARLAATALGTPAADPDYRSAWAGVATTALSRSGTDATVTFAGAPELTAPGDAGMAVQQVVYTVTAADPRLKRVRVVAPGLPAALTAAPLARAAQLAVLAPVWLLSPADGADSGRRVVLKGTASVFEASVGIEVRRGAEVAVRTVATASSGAPERGEWTATVTLPPGDYTVAAFEVSAKDGSRLAVDTKRVTVS